MRKFILIIILLCVTAPLFAQKTTARFLLWKPSAVSNAMGGTGVTRYDNAFAAYFNPAALAFTPSFSAIASYAEPIPYFRNTMHSMVGASYHLKELGTLAFTVNFTRKEGDVITDDMNNEWGYFKKRTSKLFKLSFAHAFNERYAAGLSISYMMYNLVGKIPNTGQNFDDLNPEQVLIDLGLMAKDIYPASTLTPDLIDNFTPISIQRWLDPDPQRGFAFGLSFTNYGSDVSFVDDSQADPMPTVLTGGFSYVPITSQIISVNLAADIEKQINEKSSFDYIHLGGEMTLMRFLALRAGYYKDTDKPYNSFGTWGAGIKTKFGGLNIARYQRTYRPNWHYDIYFTFQR